MTLKGVKLNCLHLIFLISLTNPVSSSEDHLYDNFFEDGSEDFLNNEHSMDSSEFNFPTDNTNIFKSSRQDEADLEVILNPGPMISPDIIIRQFVDSKVNVEKMMIDAGMLSNIHNISSAYEENEDGITRHLSYDMSGSDPALNEIPDSGVQKFQIDSSQTSNDLKVFSGSEPCRMKLSGLTGNFRMDFTKDCVILITTPEKRSRIVLNCTPIILANCTINRDTLTVNLKGDIKFGRNSYVYCGPNAQVRVTSLRRKMSIKIRKAYNVEGTSECSFESRKQRDLNTDIQLSGTTSSYCGRLGRNAKIVGGRRVSPGLFPWVAQLDITRTDGTQTACTGSLVSPEYILTAAHCLKNAESISIFMGGTDRHEFTGSEITVQAEKYILHRKWSSRTLTADIALIKLTDAIKYTDNVSPICLPSGRLRREDFNGRKGVAVGWGRVDSKRKAPRQLYRVRLPFLSEQRCQKIYRRFFIPKIMVCTDSTVDAAICYGDSGGPLMYKRKDKVYQIGIASFSLSKTCGASPDVFTHVREYVPWIESRIKVES